MSQSSHPLGIQVADASLLRTSSRNVCANRGEFKALPLIFLLPRAGMRLRKDKRQTIGLPTHAFKRLPVYWLVILLDAVTTRNVRVKSHGQSQSCPQARHAVSTSLPQGRSWPEVRHDHPKLSSWTGDRREISEISGGLRGFGLGGWRKLSG